MNNDRLNERGGSRLNFLIVMAVIGCTAYAGYLYVPVAYRAYLYKDLMQHYVDMAAARGFQASWAAEQLMKSEAEYEVPTDALITPGTKDNRIEVRVQFVRSIEFPGYSYEYEFDHTVRSTTFLAF
jgi:hypothetical protein